MGFDAGADMLEITFSRRAVLAALAAAPASTAFAAQCGDGADGFDAWLAEFRRRAADAGFSSQLLDSAFDSVAYDPEVLAHDRQMRSFGRDFRSFAAKRVTPARLRRGRQKLLAYAEPLQDIEARFGVPGPVLVAIWGLESEFGAGTGNAPTFAVLANLAYDCRRSEKFLPELVAALRLLQRGALRIEDMRGAWAGEIGQTQFLPSNYLKYAVGFDGRSRPDLIHQPEDALASTANYLAGHGWQRGQRWDEGEPNFPALIAWNDAPVYAKTIALFADELEGS